MVPCIRGPQSKTVFSELHYPGSLNVTMTRPMIFRNNTRSLSFAANHVQYYLSIDDGRGDLDEEQCISSSTSSWQTNVSTISRVVGGTPWQTLKYLTSIWKTPREGAGEVVAVGFSPRCGPSLTLGGQGSEALPLRRQVTLLARQSGYYVECTRHSKRTNAQKPRRYTLVYLGI